jgi:hypothetical protein
MAAVGRFVYHPVLWRKVKKRWRKAWEFVMEIDRKHAYTFCV